MYYLGIDLGGTNIVAGVVDEDGNIIDAISKRDLFTQTVNALKSGSCCIGFSGLAPFKTKLST